MASPTLLHYTHDFVPSGCIPMLYYYKKWKGKFKAEQAQQKATNQVYVHHKTHKHPSLHSLQAAAISSIVALWWNRHRGAMGTHQSGHRCLAKFLVWFRNAPWFHRFPILIWRRRASKATAATKKEPKYSMSRTLQPPARWPSYLIRLSREKLRADLT